jgi:hypothetical protein
MDLGMSTLTSDRLTPSTLWNVLKALKIDEDLIDLAVDNGKLIKDTDIVPGIKVLSRARGTLAPALYIQLTLDTGSTRMCV